MADLELPGGVDMADRAVDPESGLALRIVRAYDINNDTMPCRIDVLFMVGRQLIQSLLADFGVNLIIHKYTAQYYRLGRFFDNIILFKEIYYAKRYYFKLSGSCFQP